MEYRLGKYEFNSKEQALQKIKALGVDTDENGNEYPTHPHQIVHLGFLVLEQAELDEQGNITKEAVLSDKYSVDVTWIGITEHPYGWASYVVNVQGNGSHSIMGVDYQQNKI